MATVHTQVCWRHVKTGKLYRICDFAVIEKGLVPAVFYTDWDHAGPLWIRPCAEFFDGRFEMLVSASLTEELKPLGGTSEGMKGILP